MDAESWQVLSDWLSGWLEADPQTRVRLLDELAVSHPELVGEADRLSSSADSMTGFLEIPALVLAACELLVDAPVLPAGAKVGPYRVLHLLARGGMGDVYRATDSRLGRDVALKMLSPARTGDPRRVERFLLEARITASLDHPNIVRLYDVGRVDEDAYLVAELLDGETLRARILRGPIGPDEARRIALDVARGLAAAHDAGLVHRDLKPENIFLTRNGETKLLDFGIAKLTQDDNVPEGASTLTGVVLGTAGYLAPEQIRGENVDGRADLFAFGAVLFEMLSGTRAFVRDQIVDTLHAILHDPPALALENHPGVPLSLATIVGRLLEKAPAARFQSAAELIGTLQRADVGRTRSWPVRQIANIRAGLKLPVWKAAAAAMIVAAVSAGVLFWPDGPPPPPPQPHPAPTETIKFRGLKPGSRVFIDKQEHGVVGEDGTFETKAPPGTREVEIITPGFAPLKVTTNLTVGRPIEISDVNLAPSPVLPTPAAPGTEVPMTRLPGRIQFNTVPGTLVTIRQAGKAVQQFANSKGVPLPEGQYELISKGPAGPELTDPLTVASGETRTVNVRVVGGMERFDGWAAVSGWYHRKAATEGFVIYQNTLSDGRFTFTVRRENRRGNQFTTADRFRVAVGYIDAQNHIMIELDQESFVRYERRNGAIVKGSEKRVAHAIPPGGTAVHFTVQAQGGVLRVTYSIDGRSWSPIDSWNLTTADMKSTADTMSKGRFAFVLKANEELWIRDFLYFPPTPGPRRP